jgi:hypothetical protein
VANSLTLLTYKTAFLAKGKSEEKKVIKKVAILVIELAADVIEVAAIISKKTAKP